MWYEFSAGTETVDGVFGNWCFIDVIVDFYVFVVCFFVFVCVFVCWCVCVFVCVCV